MSASDAAPAPDPRLRGIGAGARLGRYRLCVEIASGGMATVFLGVVEGPAGFEKPVAVKVIHPHLAKQRQFVEMFLDEARIASRISHRNVCSVFDFGEAEGIYYIAMEYLVGEPLSRVLREISRQPVNRRSPRLPAIAAHLIADACEGLHAAHELRDAQGRPLHVVHRDVSPQNLFLNYDGCVRIVDFGIASAADRVHQTVTGTVKGKYAYMSPEQVRGKKVDRRADIWSLGVLLWEFLTLQRLFARPSQTETVLAVVEEPIPAPSEVRPGLPLELDAIALRALSRDPAARHQTARELGRDLMRCAAISDPPVSLADLAEWMERLFPEGQRRRQRLMEGLATGSAALPSHLIETPSIQELEEVPIYDPAGLEATGIRRQAGVEAPPAAEAAPTRRLHLDREEPTERDASHTRARAPAWPWVLGAAVLLGAAGSGWAWARTAAETETEEPAAAAVEPVDVGETAAPSDPPAAVETAAPAMASEEPPSTLAPDGPGEGPAPASSEQGAEAVAAPATDEPRAEPAREARRRAPGRRAAARPAGEGTVYVVTPGSWAEVWWRGRRLKQTPCRVELPAGRQTLELRPLGRTPGKRVTVEVEADEVTRIRVPIDP